MCNNINVPGQHTGTAIWFSRQVIGLKKVAAVGFKPMPPERLEP